MTSRFVSNQWEIFAAPLFCSPFTNRAVIIFHNAKVIFAFDGWTDDWFRIKFRKTMMHLLRGEIRSYIPPSTPTNLCYPQPHSPPLSRPTLQPYKVNFTSWPLFRDSTRKCRKFDQKITITFVFDLWVVPPAPAPGSSSGVVYTILPPNFHVNEETGNY